MAAGLETVAVTPAKSDDGATVAYLDGERRHADGRGHRHAGVQWTSPSGRPQSGSCWDDGQPSTVSEHMPSAHRAPGRRVPAPAPDRRARRPRLRGTLRPPRRRRVGGPRAAQAPAAAPRRQAAPSGDARGRRLHPPASAQPRAGPDPRRLRLDRRASQPAADRPDRHRQEPRLLSALASGRLGHSALVPTVPPGRRLINRVQPGVGNSAWGGPATDEPSRSPQRRSDLDRSALQRANACGDRHRNETRQLDARSGRHAVRTLPEGLARAGRAGRIDSS